MNGEEHTILDDLLGEMKENRKEVKAHGEILARLDERTNNQRTRDETQDKRMDRMEKKSAGIAAVTSALVAGGAMIAKALGFNGG